MSLNDTQWGKRGSSGPPDLDEIWRNVNRKISDIFGRRSTGPGDAGGGGRPVLPLSGIGILLALVLLVWLASGFYIVDEGRRGVVTRFGRYTETTLPGPRWHLPFPVEAAELVDFSQVKTIEIGYRNSPKNKVDKEALMLTDDENIIDIQFVVFWQIKNAGEYLFGIKDPDETVKNVAESAMREIVGQTAFELARTQGRATIQLRTLELMQKILDSYGAGILVTQVEMQKVDPPEDTIAAFRDVQAARADKERAVNEAQAYYNEVTNKAEGEAQRIIKNGEGYKAEKIAIAKGDAARFISVYDQYLLSKDITMRRIYLETMEKVMQGMNKVLVDVPGATGGGAVPYLSLNELIRRGQARPPAPVPTAPVGSGGESMGASQ